MAASGNFVLRCYRVALLGTFGDAFAIPLEHFQAKWNPVFSCPAWAP
jgi:hypothetical protein